MAFCTECGEELIEGDSFCRKCGAPITAEHERPELGWQEEDPESHQGQDEAWFEMETPKKCPACGEPLEPGTELCPACGYPIASVSASKAVNDFMKQLSEVEADASDGTVRYTRVVREIDSFAVPRSANGVLAFLIVAKGRLTTSVRDYGQGREAKNAVSQAWIAKAQHAYDVAGLMYSKAPEFGDIDKTYGTIKGIANRDNAIRGAISAAETVKKGGCLIKIVAFYAAVISLGIIAQFLNLISDRHRFIWVLLAALIVALGFHFYKNRNR